MKVRFWFIEDEKVTWFQDFSYPEIKGSKFAHHGGEPL
jgi:hypothetical protein